MEKPKTKDTKEIQKTEKAVVKKFTQVEIRDLLKKYLTGSCYPNDICTEAAEHLEMMHSGNERKSQRGLEALIENGDKYMMVLGLEKHYALACATEPRYRPFVIEFADQIIKEYDCKLHTEKALAELIANAFIMTIDCSKRLNNDLVGTGQTINETRTKYLTMLSKHLDRANRQYLNALVTLKQIKAPILEMNIKTKNAFIAQNQQINANQNKDENNEPK